MAVSRWIWREDIVVDRVPMWFPYVVFVANLAFAIVLSASVSLWIPIVLSLLLGWVPATLALSGSFRLGSGVKNPQVAGDA
jgi:hypothetical protein